MNQSERYFRFRSDAQSQHRLHNGLSLVLDFSDWRNGAGAHQCRHVANYIHASAIVVHVIGTSESALTR